MSVSAFLPQAVRDRAKSRVSAIAMIFFMCVYLLFVVMKLFGNGIVSADSLVRAFRNAFAEHLDELHDED